MSSIKAITDLLRALTTGRALTADEALDLIEAFEIAALSEVREQVVRIVTPPILRNEACNHRWDDSSAVTADGICQRCFARVEPGAAS